MSLVDHAIWWHVYPLGACGAPVHDPDVTPEPHRLRKLDAWLDYAVELGCSGLLLGPVFASTSHGYDTLDYYQLDPRLGTHDDLDHLLDQCRQRGLAVMLDGVFNHVSAHHHLVAEHSPLLKWHDDGHASWEGHGGLVELDHRNPAVADLVTDVMLHWLRRGIAGWRLDVAYAVPSEFWRDVLARVRAEFPHAAFLGEVIHGDYPALAAAGTLDSITQYELWKAIWSGLNDRNFWELAWALERHAEWSEQVVLNTFVGNHDVNRIASTVGDTGAALAAAILFTVPGMPSVYYGDEQGYRGVKTEGFRADDPLRPALPTNPSEASERGRWLYELHQRLIGFRRRHPFLSRGQLAVVDKTNTTIHYTVRGDQHTVHVTLALEPRASMRVWAEGGEEITWQAAP